MEAKPTVICLCGSTRFVDYFHAINWELTLKGVIILSIGVVKFGPTDHVGESLGIDVANRLDELHLRKIDLADEVFVINVDGYIGESTRKEIDYAKSNGKIVRYLENPDGS